MFLGNIPFEIITKTFRPSIDVLKRMSFAPIVIFLMIFLLIAQHLNEIVDKKEHTVNKNAKQLLFLC